MSTFYYEALDDATLSATNTNASFPLANLKDRDKNTQWKMASYVDPHDITIDFGAARNCDSFILDKHDLDTTGGATKKLRSSTDDITRTDVATLAPTAGIYIVEFAAQSKRYWHISHTGAGTVSSIGNLFLGKKFAPALDHRARHPRGEVYQSALNESLSARRWSSQLYTARRMARDLIFPILTAAEETNWLTFKRSVRDSHLPFYWKDPDGTTYLVRALRFELEKEEHLHWEARLSLEEEL